MNDRGNQRELLRRRAQQLATPPPTAPVANSTIEVLEFTLADERHALETAHVHEVHPLRNLAPLPCTPDFIRGLVNLRGWLVPVIDLKKFFDVPEHGITDLHRIIVLRNRQIRIGLLADTIEGVHDVPADTLQPSLPTLTGIRADYLKGITPDRLIVLDALRILDDPRLIVDEDVGM